MKTVLMALFLCLVLGCSFPPPVTGTVTEIEWQNGRTCNMVLTFEDGRKPCFIVIPSKISMMQEVKVGHNYTFDCNHQGEVMALRKNK